VRASDEAEKSWAAVHREVKVDHRKETPHEMFVRMGPTEHWFEAHLASTCVIDPHPSLTDNIVVAPLWAPGATLSSIAERPAQADNTR
jgi:hypothetical protein